MDMSDLKVYREWNRMYIALEAAYLSGGMSAYRYDQIIANTEERLGMNKWDKARWWRATTAFRWEERA